MKNAVRKIKAGVLIVLSIALWIAAGWCLFQMFFKPADNTKEQAVANHEAAINFYMTKVEGEEDELYRRSIADSMFATDAAIIAEAQRAGYKLSEAGEKQLYAIESTLQLTCMRESASVSTYLSRLYGPAMTHELYTQVTEQYILATDYQEHMQAEFLSSIQDDEIVAYYEEHPNEVCQYTVQYLLLTGDRAEEIAAEAKAEYERNMPTEESFRQACLATVDTEPASAVFSGLEPDSTLLPVLQEWLIERQLRVGNTVSLRVGEEIYLLRLEDQCHLPLMDIYETIQTFLADQMVETWVSGLLAQ